MKPSPVRGGFSLVEMLIVAGMTGFLMLLVSGMWAGMGGSLADTVAHAELLGEANLAMESLGRDLAGHQPGYVRGERAEGMLLRRLTVGGNRLMLCFDGKPPNGSADWAPPDTVVSYRVDGDQLIRVNQRTGVTIVAARHVEDFRAVDIQNGVRLRLTLSHRGLTRSYILVSRGT